ncbi:MAG: hypothetical protein PHP98_05140 [Kiritimatiellae bacterium]|nr:hypothetical protein [Kiritimatiellia bacterium]
MSELHCGDMERAAGRNKKENLRSLRFGGKIFICLLLLGAVVRIYGAWQLRFNLNPDAGIAALMAGHMAAGRDFPVFFYGQPYMGSLEPLIGAVFCALFGTSGFMAALGTAFAGWLILFAVYLWARDAHSPAAGLIAMAYCVIGPSGFIHYNVSPRGGYMAAILLSALILWLSSKLISETMASSADPENRGAQRPVSGSLYRKWFLLGLLGGLGWWSNQLIVSSLLTAALMASLFLRGKVFSRNTLLAAIGFFAGSLPFWWWNVNHGWESFVFAGSLGRTPFLAGLKMFFSSRIPDLLDLNHGSLGWRIVGAAVYAGALVFVLFFMRRMLKGRSAGRRVYFGALFVFILVSGFFFSISHFALMNTSRYLLPLVPAVAVVLGIATAEMADKIKGRMKILSCIPLLALVAGQSAGFLWLARRGAGEEAYQQQIEACGNFLRSRQVDACYAPYSRHAWNFALKENICFCDLPTERYRPYMLRAELADKIAVLDNLGDIDNFIANYGGRAAILWREGTQIACDFVPPGGGLAPVPAEAIVSIRDSLDRDVFSEITDGNIHTAWESAAAGCDDEWLEITFKNPREVAMLRLLSSRYPGNWQIAGEDEHGVRRNLTPSVATAGYIWSGPRPYWSYGRPGYRLECRIQPGTFKRLWLHRLESNSLLLELQLFGPAPAPASEVSALNELLDVLRERNMKRLYCDRWPANAVFCAARGAVETPLDPDVFGGGPPVLSDDILFTPRTGILVRGEDAGFCGRVLRERMIEMRSTKIGPWVLFDFSPGRTPGQNTARPGKWLPHYGRDCELHWAGFGCLAKNNKRWAAELADRADFCSAKGAPAAAVVLLQKALETWPFYPPAVERLARLAAEHPFPPVPEAGRWMAELKKMQPETRAEIKFDNGVEFAGISLSTNEIAAGGSLTVKYFWKYPVAPPAGRPWVFVHFLRGCDIFQDDRPLERFPGAECQPFQELFIETRSFTVPPAAPAGEYFIRIGLYDAARSDQRRLGVKSVLPSRLNAAELPVKLTVKTEKIKTNDER